MSNSNMSNFSKQQSSIRPTNGRQTVGDGAFYTDMTPSVLAVCRMPGSNMYYYSTTFSGGPGVRPSPTSKCPPDRGSPDWVTDSLTPMFSSSPPSDTSSTLSAFGTDSPASSIILPPTPPPEDYTSQLTRSAPLPDIATPPLTPDDAEDGEGSVAALSAKQRDAALEFLSTLFPRNALAAMPYAKSVSISAPNLGADFEGVVLELPNKPKTLYVDGKSAATVNLRESIVALLDLADESLQCSALVIALEKSSPFLGDLLHSLMYVGGSVVTVPPFEVDSSYVLVGLEI
ncbi:hypothetical protein DAEQUDRAFT_743902 [Daedalea quercina L-15889]|uniref:Ornithine decarboxylase antizyme n=1 Tax=Daedalea quercina L-15889 TaxID=1314783 RepID=A0A165SLC1_9APHY|nr:hypothetical protein DAEQUDRAFT_743902 [Daedalea quercina L-15889]